MDILQNLQNMLGGALSGGSEQGARAPQSGSGMGGLGGLLNPDVLGRLAGALFSKKPGMGNMGAMSGGAGGGGLLGGLLGSLMSGSGGGSDFLGQLGGLLGGGAVPAAPAPSAAVGGPEGQAERMLRAMIYAAKADGHIDDAEQRAIDGQLDELKIGPEGRDLVRRIMGESPDPARIARGVVDSREALNLYVFSCAITNVDDPRERQYLDGLAKALSLSPQIKAAVESKFQG